MARGNLGLALVLLATVGGSTVLIAPAPGTQATGKFSSASPAVHSLPGSVSSAVPSPSGYSATEILKQFLYGQDMQAPPGSKQALQKFVGSHGDPRFKYSVDSVIATLPDPIETGLSVQLDDDIDAIQHAAEYEGYLLDRYKLPWPTPAERAAKGGEAEIDQSEESEPAPDESAPPGTKPVLRSEPGILLFRDDHIHRLLVVFLVGETPISGIHKPAMRKALQQVCELHHAFASALPRGDCQGDCPPISIMGPVFSGSQESMLFAIHDWRADGSVGDGQTSCNELKIRMISGAATGIDLRRFQNSDNIDFKATVIPDSVALIELSKWIQARGMGSASGEKVAILSESNTGYGGGVRDVIMQNAKQRQGPFKAALSLRFPIHISELENAREGTASQAKIANSLSLTLHNPNLPLAPAASRERRDIVPIYSASEINTIELVLNQLLESIKQQQISCVIIGASNVEDAIFLAGEVRNSNPNVMLISLNSSLLFLHSQVNPQLQGVFVASAYPLFSANQVWTNPFWGAQSRIQFPSDTAEGAFNAVLALLGGDSEMIDYGGVFNSDARIPELWITVIGRGGVWPLAARQITDDGHYLYERASWSSAYSPTYVWPGWPAAGRLVFLQLALFFATVLLGSLWLIEGFRPEILPPPVDRFFAGATFDEWRVERRVYQAAILLLLIIELAIVMYYVSARRFHGEQIPRPNDASAALLAFRASSLGSRVSPLTPVLFALGALLALCLGALRRTRLRESRQVLTPFLDFQTPSFSGVGDLETHVRHALRRNAFNSPVWWLLMTAIIVTYGLLYHSPRSPIDGASFAALFFAISLLAYVGIAYAAYKLIGVWLSTRRLLRRLYWHPSRPGYEKLRSEIPAGEDSSIDLLSSAPSLTAFEIGLAEVRRMIAAGVSASGSGSEFAARLSGVRDSLSNWLVKTEQKLESVMAAYAQSHWRDEIRLKREAESDMSALSKVVAEVYESWWRGAIPRTQELKPKDDVPSPLDYGEIYIASRAVDWLRQVMPQLQALAFSTTVAMLLMLFAISSYPFPMLDRLLWFSWAVVAVTVGAMVWMFLSANRDRVISLISGTTPGRINWNATLVVNLVTHALLPLAVLLGAAFPERLSRLVSWLGGIFGGSG